jgi:phospholipid/cholesterol/gamma-HCH transport system substrate-binding protein
VRQPCDTLFILHDLGAIFIAMELNYSPKDRIVGTFVICIAALLLSTVIMLGRGKNWFQEYNTYYTTFDESYNLKVGADVKLFKTNIGTVKEISIEEKVKIRLAILAKYESRIRTDTLVTVESPTFIGSEYISIIPGSPKAPVLPNESHIQSRAKKSISDIMAEFEVEKTAKMFVQAIQNLSQFTENLNDPAGPMLSALENVNQTTANIEAMTDSIAAGQGTLGNLIQSTRMLDMLSDRLEEVRVILEHISNATVKTPDTIDQVQASLAQVKEIGEGVTDSIVILKRILSDIENNMPAISAILKNAEQGSRDIPQIAGSVAQGIQEARDEIENVDSIIESLKKNILIRGNLPPEPVGKNTDADLRR